MTGRASKESVTHEDRHRKDGTTVWERELEDIVRALVWSPKGDFVLAGTVADQKAALLDCRPSAPTMGMVVWSRRCDGQVEALAYHPDAKSVAIGTGRYKVTLVEAHSNRTLWERRLQGCIGCLAFAATGYHLIAGVGAPMSQLVLLETEEGKTTWQVDLDDWFRTLAFYPHINSQKGSRLLVGTGTKHQLKLLNAPEKRSSTQGWTPNTEWVLDLDARIESVAYATDGRKVAAAAGTKVFCVDELVGIVDWSKNTASMINGGGGVQCIRFAPSCQHLAATSSDEKVFILDVHTGDTVWSRDMNSSSLVLDFSPNGNYIAVGTSNFRVVAISFRHTNSQGLSLVQTDPSLVSGGKKGATERSNSSLTSAAGGVVDMRPVMKTGLAAAGERPGGSTWPSAGAFRITAPTWGGSLGSERPSAKELGRGSSKSSIWKTRVQSQSLTRSTPLLLGVPQDRREEWAQYNVMRMSQYAASRNGSDTFNPMSLKELPIPRAEPAGWIITDQAPVLRGPGLPGSRTHTSTKSTRWSDTMNPMADPGATATAQLGGGFGAFAQPSRSHI